MAQTLDSQGNVIANGYSTNLNPTQYASQNSSPAVPVPTTINSSSLGSTTPVPVTAPVYDTTGYQNSANSSLAYTASALAEAQRQAEQAAQMQRDQAASANTDIGRLSSTLNGGGTNLATSTVNQAYNEGGVNDKLSVLNRLNAESQGIGYRNTTIPLELQNKASGTGMTDRGLAPLQTKELRDNAILLASNAYQSAIARNDYETAKSKADQMIAYKYDTTLAEINAKKTNLENIRANLTVAEKKVADATTARLNKEKADAEKKMADEKAVSDMIIQASQVAPADVLKRAKDLQAKGGTALQVATVLGKYGGDYLAREKIKAEIKRIDAETAKASADAAKTRADSNGTGVTGTLAATSNAKNWVDQYNSGALSLEDIYTKIGSTKEALGLKNEVARLISAQGGKRVYGADDATVQAINAQVKNVNDLLNGDVGSIVGLVQGGLGVLPDRMNIYKQDALAVAKNLVSNQTLQALADAKSKGITFGALSEKELGIVGESASRIAAKLKTDKDGNITGFSGSEAQFKEDLKAVRDGLQKSIATKTQSTQSKEDTTADDIMKANKTVQSQISGGINLFDK